MMAVNSEWFDLIQNQAIKSHQITSNHIKSHQITSNHIKSHQITSKHKISTYSNFEDNIFKFKSIKPINSPKQKNAGRPHRSKITPTMAQVELAVARTSRNPTTAPKKPGRLRSVSGVPGGQLGWRTHGDVNNPNFSTLRLTQNGSVL